MNRSKRNAVLAVSLVVVAVAIAALANGPLREGVSSATTTPARAQQAERRWLAVAPGKVEPPSGLIKVAASTIGVVSKVLVKVNDTVLRASR